MWDFLNSSTQRKLGGAAAHQVHRLLPVDGAVPPMSGNRWLSFLHGYRARVAAVRFLHRRTGARRRRPCRVTRVEDGGSSASGVMSRKCIRRSRSTGRSEISRAKSERRAALGEKHQLLKRRKGGVQLTLVVLFAAHTHMLNQISEWHILRTFNSTLISSPSRRLDFTVW